ncbi:MAG: Ig-like domain-containing protein [Gemmatimonadota bacterium]|nr:Ig-like domain-containing protein [Gemmatimonadota bacterium]
MILAGCGGGDSGPTSPTPSTPSTPTPPAPPPTPVATSLTIAPSSHILPMIGATVQLSATVRDQNNNPMTGQTVSWTSSNTAVATVNGNGLVTAVSNGTTQITARSGNASGTSNITVAEPVPTRISITPSSHTLEAIGATVQLTASVLDQRNNAMSGQTITWSSGDEAVATVSGTGLVTAVSNGMAEITARSGSLSDSASITVEQVPAAILIAVDPDSTTLTDIDQTLQLTAAVSDANDVAIEDAAVSWSSSDESVATVDEEGLVSPVSSGMADITATAGEVSESVTITVMLPSPDRETLIAIYNATDGPNWTRQDNWLSEAPISTWQGVTTNVMDRVTRLHLGKVGMVGNLPAELGQLAYLDSLTISSIDLTGPIPAELGQLDRLVLLNLSGSSLTGPIPAELGEITGLREMYLGVNRLSGSIPAELGQLTSMDLLHLSHNELSGAIPPELGQLTALERLILDSNSLSGNIPPEIGQLSNLRSLSLSNNDLEGTVPTEIGGLTRLASMKLDGNADMTGSLPRSFLESPISEMRLSGTQICVPPDAEFQAWLAEVEVKQGITNCEVEDGDDGEEVVEIEYVPWVGVAVVYNESRGQLGAVFTVPGLGPIPLTACASALAGGELNNAMLLGATITVHYAVWQKRADMNSPWEDIEETRKNFDVCPYPTDDPGEYRLVGEVTLDGVKEFRASENTAVIP